MAWDQEGDQSVGVEQGERRRGIIYCPIMPTWGWCMSSALSICGKVLRCLSASGKVFLRNEGDSRYE